MDNLNGENTSRMVEQERGWHRASPLITWVWAVLGTYCRSSNAYGQGSVESLITGMRFRIKGVGTGEQQTRGHPTFSHIKAMRRVVHCSHVRRTEDLSPHDTRSHIRVAACSNVQKHRAGQLWKQMICIRLDILRPTRIEVIRQAWGLLRDLNDLMLGGTKCR